MAAIPPHPNQPGLPVPAPATASFASKYSDASQDPTGSNEGALLNPFVVNLADPTQNVDTRELRNRVAVSGNQRKFLGVGGPAQKTPNFQKALMSKKTDQNC
jgi:hypothetical protein